MIDIRGLDKAAVLAALFNATGPPQTLPTARAAAYLDLQGQSHIGTKFDHVRGRLIKADISGDEFDPTEYDAKWGAGSAAAAIDLLRS